MTEEEKKPAPRKRAAKPKSETAPAEPIIGTAAPAKARKAAAPKAAAETKPVAPKAAGPKPAAKVFAKTVKVTQIASPIGRQEDQRATLKGLGLNKLNRTRVLEDSAAVRGMIDRVKHLVHVEAVQ